jgi:hypothetical protein
MYAKAHNARVHFVEAKQVEGQAAEARTGTNS